MIKLTHKAIARMAGYYVKQDSGTQQSKPSSQHTYYWYDVMDEGCTGWWWTKEDDAYYDCCVANNIALWPLGHADHSLSASLHK
jgi:hypothetical protein